MLYSLRFLKISCFLLVCGVANAQTLFVGGKLEGSNSTNTHVIKMVKDAGDFNYIIGTFTDSVHLDLGTGATVTAAPGIKHSFLAAYDQFGNYQWGFALGGATDSLIIRDIVIDAVGDIVIGGTFYGTADFNPLSSPTYLTSTTGADAFIAKYSYAGSMIYANQLETSGIVGGVTSLAAYGTDIYAGGFYQIALDADPTGGLITLTAGPGNDGFVVAYDGTGAFLDSARFSGAGNEFVTDVAIGPYGDVIITGNYTVDIDMGAGGPSVIYTSNGMNDIFCGRYNLTLDQQYTVSIGGTGNEIARDVLANDYDFILLASYENTVDFAPYDAAGMFTSTGMTDVAIVRFDYSYTSLWSHSFGNINDNLPTFVIGESGFSGSKAFGSLYTFAMNFTGTMDVDPGTSTANISNSNTTYNTVAVSLRDDGSYMSNFVIEGSSLNGLTHSGNNANFITLTGNFNGTAVDVMPYDSVTTVTHSINEAGFFMYIDRCHMVTNPVLTAPYECETCTATLIPQANGGEGFISFSWGNGDYYSYNEIATGVCADNSNYYHLTADDEFGCHVTDSVWVYGHDYLFQLSATVTPVPTSCGNNFGSASAIATNALGSYSFYWSNGDTTAVADSLMAGSYFVQVTDSLMCFFTENFIIGNSDGPVITVNSANDPACGGIASGSIDVTTTGGVAPYTFLWSNGATTEDVSGLSGGTYSLIVTDAAGCTNQICLSLYQPTPLSVSFSGTLYADCITGGGAISVYPYGGYTPYTFQWDAATGFQTNDTAVGLVSGLYSVTVTDSIGCTATETFGVADVTGPYPYLVTSTNPSCSGAVGYLDIDVFGAGPYTYQWSTGAITEDVTNLSGGNYVVLVTDIFGCKGVAYNTLYQQVPYSPTLCMVTVDSTGTQNVVVWDKTSNPEAAYFNIYREGACNSFDFGIIGTTDYDSLSVFYDTVVNSDTRSWRYYVTCVDTCGFESYPSEINRTIHLTSAFNANFDVELNWGAYDGYDVTGYVIYRKNPAGTAYDYVDSVSSITLNYIDTINFSAYSEVEYFVRATTSFVCNASRAYNQNSARSNNAKAFVIADTSSTSAIFNPAENNETIKIYPNPTNDQVSISIDGGLGLGYHVDLIDQLGQTVKSVDMLYRTSFSTRDLRSGIYFVRMKNSTQIIKTFKLIVSH